MSQSQEPPRFISPAVVVERTSLSRVTLWRLSKASRFPKPVSISPGRVAWLESAVNDWMADRLAA